jgi:hypothetical protein
MRLSRAEVLIVGGGPAGMMAAETIAAELGDRATVTILDQMASPGRKFLMAGRGGLNLTHSEPLQAFLARYRGGEDRLAELVQAFPPDALRSWCEGLGQPTFVGSSGRVFPTAFKASPLLRAWLGRLEALGVRWRLRTRFLGWSGEGHVRISGPNGEETLQADAVVLAMGGASWPRLGSDGRWQALLEQQGVPVSPLAPSNVGFRVAWSPVFRERFAGAPLKGVALGIEGASTRGEAMITAWGIEGGAVYAVSGPLRDLCVRAGSACIAIDLKPDMSVEAVAQRLGQGKPGQSVSNRLRKALALPPVAIGLLWEASAGRVPAEAEALARLVKAAPIEVLGPGPIERAISSSGGVRWDAVGPGLMLERLPGVFVAGEMLDWEAPTGGYLLQACFATGVAAGHGAAAFLREGALAGSPAVP